MRAIDTDIGSNGQVRYRLRRTNTLHGEIAAVGNFFSIDAVTGRISLVRKLDREEFFRKTPPTLKNSFHLPLVVIKRCWKCLSKVHGSLTDDESATESGRKFTC